MFCFFFFFFSFYCSTILNCAVTSTHNFNLFTSFISFASIYFSPFHLPVHVPIASGSDFSTNLVFLALLHTIFDFVCIKKLQSIVTFFSVSLFEFIIFYI
uniref:Secreted protein n=1 Tax=Rhipicephalus microplus TaxID=6941 RepID=A0A6M2D9X5_RHIMP